MDVRTIQQLYDYNYWAHARVWSCVLQLSPEQLHQHFDYSIGSIHDQLVHTMSAENIWFSRIEGNSSAGMYAPTDFPTLESIRIQWDSIEQCVRDYLTTLTSDMLAGNLVYQRTNGEPYKTPLAGLLLHLVNHGTDHRAQTLALIDRAGGETIEQDLIFYLREQTV